VGVVEDVEELVVGPEIRHERSMGYLLAFVSLRRYRVLLRIEWHQHLSRTLFPLGRRRVLKMFGGHRLLLGDYGLDLEEAHLCWNATSLTGWCLSQLVVD
jgi:hypothetical protein